MSCNYADGLSPYDDKGVLGAPEKFDTPEKVDEKSKLLAKWILESQHVVVHTGAGISTAAGIPDFRGPNGVWTLEKKGLKPNINISFDAAIPTKTHMALTKLVETGYVKYIVSQNIDGLHLRSALPRHAISELHGNMFTENCSTCKKQYIRNVATTSVGQKSLEKPCPGSQTSRRGCRGRLHDTILDWEDSLPDDDLLMADYHSSLADLSICLGTTLQIVPSGNLPLLSKKYGGLLAIVNLQSTKHDKKANLLINAYIDEVIEKVMKYLGLEIPDYVKENDPTKIYSDIPGEWSFLKVHVNEMKTLYTDHTKRFKRIKLEQKLKKEQAVARPDVKKETIGDFNNDSNLDNTSNSVNISNLHNISNLDSISNPTDINNSNNISNQHNVSNLDSINGSHNNSKSDIINLNDASNPNNTSYLDNFSNMDKISNSDICNLDNNHLDTVNNPNNTNNSGDINHPHNMSNVHISSSDNSSNMDNISNLENTNSDSINNPHYITNAHISNLSNISNSHNIRNEDDTNNSDNIKNSQNITNSDTVTVCEFPVSETQGLGTQGLETQVKM